jgi:hypothetical protein
MNGCQYCVIIHNRKRHGKKRARGTAMCLAQKEMIKCDKKRSERGPGCEHHDDKLQRFYFLSPGARSETKSKLSLFG